LRYQTKVNIETGNIDIIDSKYKKIHHGDSSGELVCTTYTALNAVILKDLLNTATKRNNNRSIFDEEPECV